MATAVSKIPGIQFWSSNLNLTARKCVVCGIFESKIGFENSQENNVQGQSMKLLWSLNIRRRSQYPSLSACIDAGN